MSHTTGDHLLCLGCGKEWALSSTPTPPRYGVLHCCVTCDPSQVDKAPDFAMPWGLLAVDYYTVKAKLAAGHRGRP